jgi:hypothetical protein
MGDRVLRASEKLGVAILIRWRIKSATLHLTSGLPEPEAPGNLVQ